MRVRLLGPVDVVDDSGTPIAIGSPTQRLVLAVLGSRSGEVVPPARLVDAIWADSPPPSAEASLRSHISRLRRVLGDAVVSHPGGWSLRLDPHQLDIAEFERLTGSAREAGDPAARLAALEEALALWRGPAFGEFAEDDALRPVAVRLAEARDAAREARAAALLAVGRAADAVGAAEELLAECPWREAAWATLVAALRAGGRVAEAADAYRRAHAALAEVGLQPGPELRAAQRAALSGEPSPPVGAMPAAAAVPAAAAAPATPSIPVSSPTSAGSSARQSVPAPAAGFPADRPAAGEGRDGGPGALAPRQGAAQAGAQEAAPRGGLLQDGGFQDRGLPRARHQPPDEREAGRFAARGEPGSARRRLGGGHRPRRPVTALVGREADLSAVAGMLVSERIVTLLGPGGVGKTRLALDLADRLAGRFGQGVRFVELTSVTDGADVAPFVADALGMRVADGDVTDALELAAGMDMLVVLDNCEHVIAEAAEVAATLVGSGAGVRVLATSREMLGIDGEHCWPVRPLGVDGPAQELFWIRARAVRPDLVPAPGRGRAGTDADAGDAGAGDGAGEEAARSAVDRIVRRVDGLPLAIEMAAARVGAMSLTELADRLEQHLDLLRDTRRGGDPRHRTLADVVAWSVSLLDGAHRRMLAAMAVFAGPVRGSDAAALAGLAEQEALDLLDALAVRSLVVVDTSREPARYSLLEMIREYARTRLLASDGAPRGAAPGGDTGDGDGKGGTAGSADGSAEGGAAERLRRAHARHVLRELQRADAMLRTSREAEASRRMAELVSEARAAQTWALAADPGLAVDIAAALHVFAMTRLRVEPLHAAAELVRVLGLHPSPDADAAGAVPPLPAGVDPGAAATLLATAAVWYLNAGDLALGAACARRGLRLAGDRPARRFPLVLLSDAASYAGQTAESVAYGWEAVTASRAAGDPYAEVAGLINTVIVNAYAGDAAAGRAALAQAPDRAGLAPSEIGWLAYAEAELLLDDDPQRCLDLLDQAIALADSVDNRFLGVARVSAVSVRARCGDPAQVIDSFVEVLQHWREQQDRTHLLTTLRNLVVLFQRLDRPRAAAQLLAAVTSEAVKPSFGTEAALLAAADRWVEERLGAAAAARERAIGDGRDIEAATEAALAHLTEPS